jgi:RNA polymerase sigma factor (sigma-70 family)
VECASPDAGCLEHAAHEHHQGPRTRCRLPAVRATGVGDAVRDRVTPDPGPARREDLVQDTLLRAYRAVEGFDGRYPGAWLLTILRNTNINRARKRTPDLLRDEERTLGVLPSGGPDGRVDGAAETALARLLDDTIVAALRRLSDDHRAVVTLVDIDGLSYRLERAGHLDPRISS